MTVKDLYASVSTITITLASLASSTAGVGRQSTLISNTTNLYIGALIAVKLTMGTTPTANTVLSVYLLRTDGVITISDDGAGASDAGITIYNAPPLGQIVNPTATTGQVVYGLFDTRPLGTLGPEWGIAIVNQSGVALNSTGGNHVVEYIGINQTVV